MHNVSRIAALVLVVLATVLALVAFTLGKRRPDQDTPPPVAAAPVTAPPVPVAPAKTAHAIVAAQALPAGEVIPAAALRDIAVSTAPEGSYGQIELLVGQVPRVDIPEGTVVTSALLANPIAMQLRPGERALAVPVDEVSGVGYRVQPGDYVDVVVTLKMEELNPAAMGRQHTDSRLLAARLRVLAYGARDLPNVSQPTPATKNEATEAAAKMAVLAVPLAEVDPLVLGLQAGKVSLALRHPGDPGMPSDLLFPLPPTVLAPRSDLSAEQRAWLLTPENRAFAGVEDAGLLGRIRTSTPAIRPHTPTQAGPEIIRGTNVASSHAPLAVTP
ncbi:Flp pilus assembly protein CpaB [Dyella kyungheensis]|uniref:Flp pilus assembly protein CpaB n=1 Tax=Dyella kyungheensis TaxID=1242174 RepID=UPI003CF42D0D